MSSSDDHPMPPAEQKRASGRELVAKHYYGLVLLLITLSFAFGIAVSDERWGAYVYFILQAGTLLLALRASGPSKRTFRIALVLVIISVVVGTVSALTGTERTDHAVTGFLAAALVMTAIVAILRDLVRHAAVDARTIMGALCVYLLVGLFYAFVYQLNGALDRDAFFSNGQDGTASEYIYFSYVTLATVGFGDLTARGDIGRAFVVIEAIMGQLYLVTVVGFTVGNVAGRQARARSHEDDN